jgi:hypothetical protein
MEFDVTTVSQVAPDGSYGAIRIQKTSLSIRYFEPGFNTIMFEKSRGEIERGVSPDPEERWTIGLGVNHAHTVRNTEASIQLADP